jgi:hypothetical protein
MPARQPSPQPPRRDRRAPAGARGPLHRLRRWTSLLRRPITLQHRDGKWRLVFVDRRRAGEIEDRLALQRLHAELRASLLNYAPEQAAQLLRQLVQVHDELLHKGWAGVQALPAAVRSKALFQAELLAREAATPALLTMVVRLRALQAPPEPAQAPAPRPHASGGKAVEVFELSPEDFQESERSWFGGLQPAPSGATEQPDTAQ